MRTAEEILNSYDDSAAIHWLDAIDAMKEYAKEAIEECAERAVVFMPSHPHLHRTKNIDKESILSLIKELK